MTRDGDTTKSWVPTMNRLSAVAIATAGVA